ncbi:Uncharacterised protein [Enterobacter cloacae]|nr:Uncharacterised protein [Enterobacter cloacae]
MAIVPERECIIPTLMVSAAWMPKLIPMAMTEADKVNALIKVRRCIFSLLKRKLCEDVRYRRTQKKVTPVSGEQKQCQVAETGF